MKSYLMGISKYKDKESNQTEKLHHWFTRYELKLLLSTIKIYCKLKRHTRDESSYHLKVNLKNKWVRIFTSSQSRLKRTGFTLPSKLSQDQTRYLQNSFQDTTRQVTKTNNLWEMTRKWGDPYNSLRSFPWVNI